MKKTVYVLVIILAMASCKETPKKALDTTIQIEKTVKYPSDVIPFMDKWKILLGDGTQVDDLVNC